MFLDFYHNIPLKIDPIVFSVGSFSLRWYSLSYIIGLMVIWVVAKKIIKYDFESVLNIFYAKKDINFITKEEYFKKDISDKLLEFLLMEFIVAIVFGRIGYAIIYKFDYFIFNPAIIFSPFNNGKFQGIFGMSYHGAFVGCIIFGYLFAKIKKINFFKLADFFSVLLPAGYFFGRIGNFLNGELYGRKTNFFLGMYFNTKENQLRFPSQIIEAFLEGILIFIILFFLRKKINKDGVLFFLYFILYGFFRIVGEFFREPDYQLGFVFFSSITMGQILSAGMIFIGFSGIFLLSDKNKCYNEKGKNNN